MKYIHADMINHETEYLTSHRAAHRDHSATSLLSHLIGTRNILEGWDARRSVCLAGMFHSVYGTQSFEGLLELKDRPDVRRVIGHEAEELAYLFCAMTKATLLHNIDRDGRPYIHDRFTGRWLFITQAELVDLCNITAANWLEQVPRIPDLRYINPDQFLRMLPLLLPKAQQEISGALHS